ncbi:hypothetical protein L7F22_063150, partial [Adiantum nelumboides]|nr:hypothetical protein [Adiantum nelumboides]
MLWTAPLDWQDFIGIIILLLVKSTISFVEENNTGNAAVALMANIAPRAKVCIKRINVLIFLKMNKENSSLEHVYVNEMILFARSFEMANGADK